MNIIKELKDFIRFHIKNSRFGVILANAKDISEPIIKALNDLSKTIQGKRNDIVNPEEISDPIVEAQKATTEAVKGIKIPEPIPVDFSSLEVKIEALIEAVKAQELSVKTGDVNVDFKPVIKAIEKIKLEVPKMKKEEVVDYTLMLDEMMKIMEDKTEIVKLQELVKRLGTSDDLAVLAEWLKVIANKEYPELPDFKFTKSGRLKVEVDRAGGGGGGGLTSIQEGFLKNISDTVATEAKQDAIITAINGISGSTTYNYIQSEETGTYKYYGFASSTGWQIKRKTLATGVWEVAYEDFTGTYNNFDDAWTARAGHSYSYA